jgi:hypothetical protein
MSVSDWIKICLSAGVNVRNMDPMDVYLAAAKILADRRDAQALRVGLKK